MGNVNIDWTYQVPPNNEPRLTVDQAMALLDERFKASEADPRRVLADAILRILPENLRTQSYLTSGDLSPIMSAMKQAIGSSRDGSVNGVPLSYGFGDTAFRQPQPGFDTYAQALRGALDEQLGVEQKRIREANKAALYSLYPPMDAADEKKILDEMDAVAAQSKTIGVPYDFTVATEIANKVTNNGTRKVAAGTVASGGAEVPAQTDASGAVTPGTPAPGASSGNSFMDAVAGTTTAEQPGEGMTEADMRSAFSTGELQWNQIREAVANGTANPMVQTGFPNQMGGDSGALGPVGVGAPQRMPYGFGGKMSLLDAAQQISLRSPAEIAAMQRRMVAAGYLGAQTADGSGYRPGVADAATRAAWTNVIQEAWYGGTSVTQVLATQQNAMDERRAAMDKAAVVSDPQAFHLLANQLGQNVLGRDLTPSEQVYVRTHVLELERQQRQALAEGRQSFEVDQQAQIEDWLMKFAPQEAQANEMFGQAFDLARATGRPLKLASPPSNETIAQYLMMGQRNSWTLDRVLQQIFMDAGEVSNAG